MNSKSYGNCRVVVSCLSVLLLAVFAPDLNAQTKAAMDEARARMVQDELVDGGIKNERVLRAMGDTRRHEFVALKDVPLAYYDMSLPIGDKQTISGPFVVAYMTEQLDPQPTDKVLEIGTGSGYQAAVLSPLCKEVYSIEIVESLGKRAARTLKRLKYTNVKTKVGDGYLGWAEHAPFDKIIVTCSPEKVPQPLIDQLKEGGRIVVPVGERYQQVLYLLRKKNGKMEQEILRPTMFVPMTGKAEQSREVQPDPAKPTLTNGSFEELAGDSGEPVGWYYQRQMTVEKDDDSPLGKQFVRFSNTIPGRASRMMQATIMDGRHVQMIELSLNMRGKDIRPGQSVDQLPVISVTFYDENRAIVGRAGAGPWRGGFDWQKVSQRFKVPKNSREAIVHLGLLGATGELDIDGMELHAVDRQGQIVPAPAP
ncbi:MAG: protein-L-isoaspartate(D-aspartate) O-methyltransferase [Planctomycetota bacterium]|nr:protein-L-isoaspartate(D-aspartate) O-methyltransferase [Planctomycetota bacterium]